MIVSGFTQKRSFPEDQAAEVNGHSHCIRCLRSTCTTPADQVTSCEMMTCDLCGWRCHRCKQAEHTLACPEEKVTCVNKEYGCPHLVKRSKMAAHLPVCPASVVCCSEEWSRWPMHNREKGMRLPLPETKTYIDCGQLDIGLAMRDQRMLIDSLRAPRKLRRTLRNALTQKYPAAPLMPHGRSHEVDMAASSDTSHTLSDDESDAPWDLSKPPPGLSESIKSKLFLVSKETTDNLVAALSKSAATRSSSQDRLSGVGEASEVPDDRGQAVGLSFRSSSLPPDHTKGDNEPDGSAEPEICLHKLLGLNIGFECINKYVYKSPSMYNFICAQNFRRDQFPWHFKNVHQDIHQGSQGWLEQRCPLAYLGCNFSFSRLEPAQPGAHVYHSWLQESFGLRRSDLPTSCSDTSTASSPSQTSESEVGASRRLRMRVRPSIYTAMNWDSKVLFEYEVEEDEEDKGTNAQLNLLDLPYEILQAIAKNLDSFSLCNLALTSRKLRDICCSLLDDYGIVLLNWQRQKSGNGVTWKVVNKRWMFSTSFEPIRFWRFKENVPHMGDHLKECPFNKDIQRHTEKVLVMDFV
ncbi:hypothetical protein EGW08_002352 [Elysia chlorotica]|uniref:F-box domain-containing protein n=1 Tax=Elysia chlorotica TaxID=188477 RepID=A0A3S1BJQ9_ELYCH|nr:hypothetical protein EGW08_002352 [Elysia chlorotica]